MRGPPQIPRESIEPLAALRKWAVWIAKVGLAAVIGLIVLGMLVDESEPSGKETVEAVEVLAAIPSDVDVPAEAKKPPPRSAEPSASASAIQRSAVELCKIFERDEDWADRIFTGKTITVSGIALAMSSGRLLLKADGEYNGVFCIFPESREPRPDDLPDDSFVSVMGVYSWYTDIGEVVLEDCILLGPGDPSLRPPE